jgi:multidrug efflux pump
MISRIFIDRPIFAWVIAIVVMLVGIGGVVGLPVSQYPDIAPPTISIRATYPGASPETLEASVTQIIEQQLTGIDGMLYFQSTSTSSGQVTIQVTLDKGINPDIGQVQVQNKVQQALPRLPQQVQQQGLTVTKSNTDFLMVIAVYDQTDHDNTADISDYLVTNLQDGLARIPGVGDYNVFGAQYAMRIWLDPYRLQGVGLMPNDVISAIQAQNTQVAAGQIGALPSPPGQMLTALVTERSRLTTADQFRKIILKTQTDGSKVLLQDVARVELGSESYNVTGEFNHHPVSGIAVQLAPGADALKTSALVHKYVENAAKRFPPGYKWAYLNDASDFIKLSIKEVVITLVEAILLVVLVMFLFLQSWRATLIPAVAVPVVLFGTFGVLAAAGLSINTLTLFGLVLSIGLLVDDAIVVVENVERVLAEDPDMTPREATIKSMAEINTALIAIAMVLSAVFLPMAFFGGSTGVIYKQFSITIVSSMALSVFVALVLSPAIAATLLKRPDKEGLAERGGLIAKAHGYGDRFNAWFFRNADRYRDAVRTLFDRKPQAMLAFGALVLLLVLLFFRLPTGFVPNEDQGFAQGQFTLPAGATLDRTIKAARTYEDYLLTKEAKDVDMVYFIAGSSQQGQGQNTGRSFMGLKPWDERKGKENSADALTARATKALSTVRDAQIVVTTPPPVRGLGQSSGFTLELLNSTAMPRAQFKSVRDQLLREATADPDLAAVRQNVLEDAPTLKVEVDQEKVGALGLSQAQVDQTLSTAWGGTYINDFVDRGRVKRVYVQGDAQYRSRPEDLGSWYVRSSTGQMVPFSAFARLNWNQAPYVLTRFNGVPSIEIQGQGAPGKSSGDAMKRIEQLASKLPGVTIAWAGLSYQERLAGSQAPLLYLLSLIVVFLCLSALYESWSIPLAVIMVIPLGLIGATLAVTLRGLENDVYFQVGLLTTMGLSAKNAILIVEFAEQAERQGMTPVEAALSAARTRLRPILMTSIAFMAGVLPLAISSGAGAKSRNAIGTAVFGGMLSATALAIFFVPLFFVLVRTYFPGKHQPGREAEA